MGGCVRMNSDDNFPIRQALLVGPRVLLLGSVFCRKNCVLYNYNTFT